MRAVAGLAPLATVPVCASKTAGRTECTGRGCDDDGLRHEGEQSRVVFGCPRELLLHFFMVPTSDFSLALSFFLTVQRLHSSPCSNVGRDFPSALLTLAPSLASIFPRLPAVDIRPQRDKDDPPMPTSASIAPGGVGAGVGGERERTRRQSSISMSLTGKNGILGESTSFRIVTNGHAPNLKWIPLFEEARHRGPALAF